jgi:hypothetical protein
MSRWDDEFVQHQMAMAEEPESRRVFSRATYLRRAVRVFMPKAPAKTVERVVKEVAKAENR